MNSLPVALSSVAAVLLCATSTAFAAPVTVADIAADWELPVGGVAVGGTNRGWTYHRTNEPAVFVEYLLLTTLNTGTDGGIGFAADPGAAVGLPAVVGDNSNGGDYELFFDGDFNSPVVGTDLLVHPGGFSDSQFVIARYTFSAADLAYGNEASIFGSFRNLVPALGGGGDAVDVAVYHNATVLFGYDSTTELILTQADGTFDLRAFVAVGDTISFAVGQNGNFFGDETAIRAQITLVPEPSTLSLTALGLIGLLGGGWLRKKKRTK